MHAIELYADTQPFIDFHIDNYDGDYSYRILGSNTENLLLFQGRNGEGIDRFMFSGNVEINNSHLTVDGDITTNMNITASNGTVTGRYGKFTSQLLIGPKGENAVTVNDDEGGHAIALKWKKTGVTSAQSGLYVYIDDSEEYGPIITNNR